MRGAWGKPYGTVARVNIGQIILSIRCKDASAPVIQEALRRARYKFPGRQKIIVSKKWGFTNVNREEYQKLKEDKLVVQCVSCFHSVLNCIERMIVLLIKQFLGMALMYSSFVRRARWSTISGRS